MMRILIVDDDPVVRETMAILLGSEGFDVHGIADSRDGLIMPDGSRPDVLIADILIPNVQGAEFIRHTRQNEPEVKIIAMTAGGTVLREQLRRTAEQLGADAVLPKPFTSADLRQKVSEVSGLQKVA